ncbi:uncharacterized protein EDB93DRAFT_47699 [Suillus bovinus]|uniref:uncharacterized protein n=1 Tax=Suillus bovinus TaxID=48563 RepID=UPI001B85D616|nr:uncharacterized protein EDB93DRAFT_47699 [Suillus bovinus]KAG2160223.1 hypothetical protein EDB93DRAFT_47699 [Suillus bovinus]
MPSKPPSVDTQCLSSVLNTTKLVTMAEEADQPIVPKTEPVQTFEDHENTDTVLALSVFPDGRHMVTGSADRMLRLWDLEHRTVLKKIEGHHGRVRAVAVAASQDRQLIASADNGEVVFWDRDSGESLTPAIKAHSTYIRSLDFSPDGMMLATGSMDHTVKLWNTETWQQQGNPINCKAEVYTVRYSPSGELLAIATNSDIQIWNPLGTRNRIAHFKDHMHKLYVGITLPLAWIPDGTRLLSGGCRLDPTIRQWDVITGQQVGDPWRGHNHDINAIAVNSDGTLVASASTDHHVRLWQLWDRKTIAIFRHSSLVRCIAFSVDGKRIISGSDDKKISEWTVPEHAGGDVKMLTINTMARNACIAGDLYKAEELLTREIDAIANKYNSYANRSFVMARKRRWDRALQDASKSVDIQPSFTGYISKGIALCGRKQVRDAIKAFDLASMFTGGDIKANHFLLLVKAAALFNADQHEEAMIRVQELAEACPSADTRACWVVKAYLHVELGNHASDDARHKEAANHFTAAVNISSSFSKLAIHSKYEDFVVLFGWDLKSLWETANKKRCFALLKASRVEEALEAHRYMMDKGDESTKANCLDWSTGFKQECSALYLADGDAALSASDYEKAITLYSSAIDLAAANDTFRKRCEANVNMKLWENALLDAQKVVELDPSSHIGYELKHTALHGLQRYDASIEAFQTMLLQIENAPETQIRQMRQQYRSPAEAERDIREVIHNQLTDTPLRLLDTATGLLCDREAQISVFKTSTEYKELVSSTIKDMDLRMERIAEVVTKYFRCVMLSHRWEEKEALLHDIQDKVIYELEAVGGIMKLQSFCKIAREAHYRWAWMDTCCIDKNNNTEVQESLNSMFIWYRHSALTIVYLSDVPPSSKAGALVKSAWNSRGWTVQEFLAPKVILFYQSNWTLYLNDHSPNHKESAAIMQELEDATGIDAHTVITFHPGMTGAREKLRWASARVTTVQEDVAYSLFGIFDIHLPVIYGERKQNALGRLLQEIVAQSGDITALDWSGESSEFNSCLPASITSYEGAACKLSSPSEDEIQTSISMLRNDVTAESASELYTRLSNLSAPRFAHRRLDLPCIVFSVTEIRRSQAGDRQSYEVKADGLYDLSIRTGEKLILFSPARPIQKAVFLVRPWNHHLLDDTQRVKDGSVPQSALQTENSGPVDLDPYSRDLRLIVRLGQEFSAFLLMQQRGREYKRIASDRDIIAQVKDMTSIHNMTDVRSLEIL